MCFDLQLWPCLDAHLRHSVLSSFLSCPKFPSLALLFQLVSCVGMTTYGKTDIKRRLSYSVSAL